MNYMAASKHNSAHYIYRENLRLSLNVWGALVYNCCMFIVALFIPALSSALHRLFLSTSATLHFSLGAFWAAEVEPLLKDLEILYPSSIFMLAGIKFRDQVLTFSNVHVKISTYLFVDSCLPDSSKNKNLLFEFFSNLLMITIHFSMSKPLFVANDSLIKWHLATFPLP